MERIKIFKRKKEIELFYIIFGLLSLTLGITILIKSLRIGFKTDFFEGGWNAVIYCLQGIIFFIIGLLSRKNEKYFIEWNNKELRYLFPKNKLVETIKLSEIKGVEIDTLEINIELSEGGKKLNLDNIQYKEVRKIKEIFKEIKITI